MSFLQNEITVTFFFSMYTTNKHFTLAFISACYGLSFLFLQFMNVTCTILRNVLFVQFHNDFILMAYNTQLQLNHLDKTSLILTPIVLLYFYTNSMPVHRTDCIKMQSFQSDYKNVRNQKIYCETYHLLIKGKRYQ